MTRSSRLPSLSSDAWVGDVPGVLQEAPAATLRSRPLAQCLSAQCSRQFPVERVHTDGCTAVPLQGPVLRRLHNRGGHDGRNGCGAGGDLSNGTAAARGDIVCGEEGLADGGRSEWLRHGAHELPSDVHLHARPRPPRLPCTRRATEAPLECPLCMPLNDNRRRLEGIPPRAEHQHWLPQNATAGLCLAQQCLCDYRRLTALRPGMVAWMCARLDGSQIMQSGSLHA